MWWIISFRSFREPVWYQTHSQLWIRWDFLETFSLLDSSVKYTLTKVLLQLDMNLALNPELKPILVLWIFHYYFNAEMIEYCTGYLNVKLSPARKTLLKRVFKLMFRAQALIGWSSQRVDSIGGRYQRASIYLKRPLRSNTEFRAVIDHWYENLWHITSPTSVTHMDKTISTLWSIRWVT